MDTKIIDRIDKLISHYELSYNEFDAQILNRKNYIANAIRQKSDIRASVLTKIYFNFPINADWLLAGKEPMFRQENSFSEEKEVYNIRLGKFDQSVLESLQKPQLINYIKGIIDERLTQK